MKTIRHKFIVNTGGSTAEVESTTGAPGLIRMVETQPLRMAAEPGARVTTQYFCLLFIPVIAMGGLSGDFPWRQ